VHFSVHAAADQTTPLAGGLLLHDGRLTIGQLAELRLPRASFAFLSACETHHGILSISNEGITLGSAMRIAGYPHVIATLWSVSDTSTPELVLRVYRRMVSRSQTAPRLDPEVSAEALHAATRHIRDLHQDQPDRWSPFVHIGLGLPGVGVRPAPGAVVSV
jgi:CHAT domain-containing protein